MKIPCLQAFDRYRIKPRQGHWTSWLAAFQRFNVPTSHSFHEPYGGRDIALRCPRPRSSGRNEAARVAATTPHVAPLVRGADGAARRPYQVHGRNARETFSAQSQRGFTMIEIALCLAIIGFALVAIIAVLPTGLNVQRDNRQETIMNQDAVVWMNAIRNGAEGFNDLTNYVTGITNYWTKWQFHADGTAPTVQDSGEDDYAFTGSRVTSIGGIPNDSMSITNGRRIIGLLSTPQWLPSPMPGEGGNFRSNYIVAYVRAFSGAAVEKPPQRNDTILDSAFRYRMIVENVPYVPVQPEFKTNDATRLAYSVLSTNSHDLRILFRWPVLPNGDTGNGRHTFRLFTGGVLQYSRDEFENHPLFFFQPSTYVQPAP